jgi:geranylgeranyl pyrophosphate synthase
MKKIRRILLDWNINKNNVDELIEIIYDTVGMYQLRALLKELKNEAIIALNRLRENQAKKDLQLLISAMIEDL